MPWKAISQAIGLEKGGAVARRARRRVDAPRARPAHRAHARAPHRRLYDRRHHARRQDGEGRRRRAARGGAGLRAPVRDPAVRGGERAAPLRSRQAGRRRLRGLRRQDRAHAEGRAGAVARRCSNACSTSRPPTACCTRPRTASSRRSPTASGSSRLRVPDHPRELHPRSRQPLRHPRRGARTSPTPISRRTTARWCASTIPTGWPRAACRPSSAPPPTAGSPPSTPPTTRS